jgi:hypothetical protein
MVNSVQPETKEFGIVEFRNRIRNNLGIANLGIDGILSILND